MTGRLPSAHGLRMNGRELSLGERTFVDTLREAGWRPGGYQPVALHDKSGRIYVGMHPKGKEGSHKSPAKEIWAFDLGTLKRTARIPSNTASSIVASQGAEPFLYSLNVERGEIDVRAIGKKGYPKLRTIPRVGDTAVFMEVN